MPEVVYRCAKKLDRGLKTGFLRCILAQLDRPPPEVRGPLSAQLYWMALLQGAPGATHLEPNGAHPEEAASRAIA
eukprot:1603596-Pleurochrysis_carterae.AAC.1